MNAMTYGEQLRHPKWQRKRLRILNRDGWMCTACCSTEKTLHVHHKVYVKGRKVWEYDDADLRTMCEDCHQIRHEVEDQIKRLVANLDPGDVLEFLIGLSSIAPTVEEKRAMFDASPCRFAAYAASTIAVMEWEDAEATLEFAHRRFMASVDRKPSGGDAG